MVYLVGCGSQVKASAYPPQRELPARGWVPLRARIMIVRDDSVGVRRRPAGQIRRRNCPFADPWRGGWSGAARGFEARIVRL